MRSDRQSLTGWGRWDSGSTVRTDHSGRAQAEQSRTGAVGARLNKRLVTAGKLFLAEFWVFLKLWYFHSKHSVCPRSGMVSRGSASIHACTSWAL